MNRSKKDVRIWSQARDHSSSFAFIIGAGILLFLMGSVAFVQEERRMSAVQMAQIPNTDQIEKPDALQNLGKGIFGSSLEMKENVDFLLTPAILVQEVISEDVIVTYPEE